MKIKFRLLIINLAICIGIMFALPLESQATLQSNGNTATKKDLQSWLVEIRNMETLGGTLGLSDTINSTSLVSDGESNNLDIHMQKNTEYGAMAILSASSYGNPSKINDGDTTTGNKSGIYMKLNGEWTASGNLIGYAYYGGIIAADRYQNANSKYKNVYNLSAYAEKRGDAIKETNNWHGSTCMDLMNDKYSGYVRALAGSIFSYTGEGSFYGLGASSGNAAYTLGYASRACIVNGSNF